MTETQEAMIQILTKATEDIRKNGYTYTKLGNAIIFCNTNHAYVEIELQHEVVIKARFNPIEVY
jgi:hypothetical protein